MRNLSNKASREAIQANLPFTNSTGSLWAVQGFPSLPSGNWLNDEEMATFESHRDRIVYTVFSYDTPIAWVLVDGTKYRVAQKFTVTTSKHMGLTWQSDSAKVEA